MSASFELTDPDRVTVGAVGVPGARTFYLQARQGDRLVTLKLEKQQVAGICELLGELLADLPTPTTVPSAPDLEEPALAEWVVGGVQLAFDTSLDRVVLLAEEALAAGSDDEGAIGRLAFTREQAAALVARGEALVEAGRPPCPLCGHPLDPEGHSCPKTNGHRAPTP
ncbi:MAG TPA: DUF3090 family protein [Acidimicrobiales bacterium]|nr:DUF3090 family protein [Acidimicrobiales bacterium]